MPISWSALYFFLKFRQLRWAVLCFPFYFWSCNDLIDGNFRQNPNTRGQRSCRRAAEATSKGGRKTVRLWLEDLCFDMLDQKYGLGKKTFCSTLAPSMQLFSSWLESMTETTTMSGRPITWPGSIGTPLLSGCIHSHSPNLETIQLRPFPLEPVVFGGRVGPLQLPWNFLCRTQPQWTTGFGVLRDLGTYYHIGKCSVPCESFRWAYKIEILG